MSRNIRKMGRALDRDILAEKAATMVRKGHSAASVCEALNLADTNLRRLAADYGFRYPASEWATWPRPEEPGDLGKTASAYDNWARAVAGARATLAGSDR